MKRIETLNETARKAMVETLNAAAVKGVEAYHCPGSLAFCPGCPMDDECDIAQLHDPAVIKTFPGWLNWLCADVDGTAIKMGYRVWWTGVNGLYWIQKPDGTKVYAKARPLTMLLFQQPDFPTELQITDVFASRYGATCLLVKDESTGNSWLYFNKLI